jgi:hypothetical protein
VREDYIWCGDVGKRGQKKGEDSQELRQNREPKENRLACVVQ